MKRLKNLNSLNNVKTYLSQCWQQFPTNCLPTNTKNLKNIPLKTKAYKSLILFTTISSLTSVVGYRFYSQPRLAADTVSPITILAPHDGSFVDSKTTEKKQKEVRNGIVPVLKIDEVTNLEIRNKINTYFQEVDQLRAIVSRLELLDLEFLPLDVGQKLLQCNDWEFQHVINNETTLKDAKLEQARLNIDRYRQQVSPREFAIIRENLILLRQDYKKRLEKNSLNTAKTLTSEQLNMLVSIKANSWENTKKIITETVDKMTTQGIAKGLTIEVKRKAIARQIEDIKEPAIKAIILEILLNVLEANLVIDEQGTKDRAERVLQAMEPVLVTIRKGEVIVNAGQKISQEQFVLLDGFKLSKRETNWLGLGLSSLLVISAVIIFILVARTEYRTLRHRDLILISLLSLTSPLLIIFDIHYTSLPAVALLVSSFYSPKLALTQIILLSGLVGFASAGNGWEYFLAETAGAMVAAAMAGRLHSREDLAFLGATIGLTQGLVYLTVNLILSASAKAVLYVVLPGAIFYGLSGVAWVILALGISPYLERFFDVITPIRLAELSNPNRPLLKKLAIEAPGTFQHTMFVASLAEAAARELHCNVELVRAGTLYHDIGKLHDPLGFIENQMGGSNKHDQINNPWESAAIIKKHVTEGLVMARQYRLPKAIGDFIPEHQGTLLITYFYFQARQKAQHDGGEVLTKDFQYDGPIPQSRETGIVMLADGCEAALRSLKEVTPEEALATVKKIFKSRWRDQQLAESGIKYEELPVIAEIFIRVWQQYNHQRIAYPKVVI
jgi:putative nucleotidyltransferase with HDIG domain